MNRDDFDWGGSYSCEWRLMTVDKDTWDDASEVHGVISMSVSRDCDGDLIDEGSATISMDPGDRPTEFWGRLEVLAGNGGVYRTSYYYRNAACMVWIPLLLGSIYIVFCIFCIE